MKFKDLKKLFEECDDDTEIFANICVSRKNGRVVAVSIET